MSKLQTRSNELLRAADTHLVLAAIHPANPKPSKEARAKKKGHLHGICPECGVIWHDKNFEHAPYCNQEIPVIWVRKNQTPTQLVKMALDELCRLITIWRDGCNCVISSHECRGDSQWGHLYPQGSNAHLVYELSNSFRQCEGHNSMHRFVQAPYFLWYQRKFGHRAFDMLEAERLAHPVCEYNITDYKEMQAELSALYLDRHRYTGASIEEKVYGGWYGNIIKEAWVKEGRI